jgi:hypothetical protein
MVRKKWSKVCARNNRSDTWSPTAVRYAESLMKIEVRNICTELAGLS